MGYDVSASMTDATEFSPVAVSPDRHAGCFWRRFTSYAFARGQRCVDVVMAELEPAASAFPLVFRPGASGGVDPVALLRLGATGTTPFVAPDGTWRGTYVPSGLRAHPFSARHTGTGDEMVLMVDEASGLVTEDPADQPFFAGDAPAPPLAQVIAFFRTRAKSAQHTAQAAAALQAHGLLSPLPPLPGMTEGDAAGFLAVDPARLEALDHAVLPALWESGALRLAEAHRVSLLHAGWMARAMRAEARAAASGPARPEPPDDGLSGFLDALSEAHDRERGGA